MTGYRGFVGGLRSNWKAGEGVCDDEMGKCRAAVGWGKTALGGSKQDKRPAGLPELAL
ncbi:unnamed protein product, partial [Nippostrongylus brasiliensis]|uniref:Uncharacterized protein n=1 Tax=Nippostrongylus brasiliensis TaxID=27835 RepID=A0A0N4YBM2_NIPBR